MKKGIFLITVLLLCIVVKGQPINDCKHAYSLCSFDTLHLFPNGAGTDTNELPATCLQGGEHNSAWFTFGTATAGNLAFLITPDSAEDYNFVLFDITDHTCFDLAGGLYPVLRCDYAVGTGITGISSTGTATTADSTGSIILRDVQVLAGKQYMLMVDNRNSHRGGFKLNFQGTTTTAKNISNTPNFISPTDTFDCRNRSNWERGPYQLKSPIAGTISVLTPTYLANILVSNANDTIVDIRGNDSCISIQFLRLDTSNRNLQLIFLPGSLPDNCGNLNTVSDTVNITLIPPVFKSGFVLRKTRGAVSMFDTSIIANSVYYIVHDSAAGTTSYLYARDTSYSTISGGKYNICQVAKYGNDSIVTCKDFYYNDLQYGNEQDCDGAIKLCGRALYQDYSYKGYGLKRNELPSNSCLQNSENNSVWYQFEIKDPGLLSFLIYSVASIDDYDFSLYNITGHTCADIADYTLGLEVRCDYAISSASTLNPIAVTGIDTSGHDTITHASAGGATILAPLQVYAGEKFRLVIDNFNGQSVSGFQLDFTHTTATFVVDSFQQLLESNYDTAAGGTQYMLRLATYIDCSTLDTNGGDFILGNAPPNMHITKVQPLGLCASTVATVHQLLLTFDNPPYPNQTLDISLRANTVTTFCGITSGVNETTHLYCIGNNVVAGFAYSIVGDTLFIQDGSLYGDSVYYYVLDSGVHKNQSAVSYYYARNPHIILPGKGYYTVCQVAMKGILRDTFCKVIDTYDGIPNVVEEKVTIYPNPTTGRITISLPSRNANSVQLYNILGALVTEQKVTEGSQQLQMDLSAYPRGTYILRVSQQVFKVIKY